MKINLKKILTDDIKWTSSSILENYTTLSKMVIRGECEHILSAIQIYLEINPDKINKKNKDENGTTALMVACMHSSTKSNHDIVSLLLELGADPNITDGDGCSFNVCM